MRLFNKHITKEHRRDLRKNQTAAEKVIWSKVRNKQINGYKFFRQFGIGQYIVDFYCPQLKLAVEVDGGQHYLEAGQAYDRQRDEWIRSAGIKILRFSNVDVLKNSEGVFKLVYAELPTAPSLAKRG